MLTDGANNSGEISPETAADAARALGIKVYTIGMGRPGEVPVPVDSLLGGKEIVYVESDLDEALLQQIAEKTGGQYFRATDTADLQRIYDHIDALEKSQIEITHYSEEIELIGWVLLPALMLILSEQFLSYTLFRRIHKGIPTGANSTSTRGQVMTFGSPIYLYALILVPLSLLFLVWADRRRKRAIARMGEPHLIARLSLDVNTRGRVIKAGLWLSALALLLIALARPQWGETRQTVTQKGVQVMVVLDTSKSMLAEDVKPDRLTRAKMDISELMNRLNGDEVGLTVFSGASFTLFPLTSDYNTARSFLDIARPGIVSRPGTAIGDAIRTAMRGFDQARTSQKVIVLMTDGEDDQTAMDAAAKEACGSRCHDLHYRLWFQ